MESSLWKNWNHLFCRRISFLTDKISSNKIVISFSFREILVRPEYFIFIQNKICPFLKQGNCIYVGHSCFWNTFGLILLICLLASCRGLLCRWKRCRTLLVMLSFHKIGPRMITADLLSSSFLFVSLLVEKVYIKDIIDYNFVQFILLAIKLKYF
jgi:hypothetical protein